MQAYVSENEAKTIEALFGGTLANEYGGVTNTLLAAGSPRSGKTRFALGALIEGLRAFGDGEAVMAVSGRQAADLLGDRVIRELRVTSQSRPVTTLAAIGFDILTRMRARRGEPLPRLLNGAEQDALLRRVVAVHIRHAQTGDACETCALLREYFAFADWTAMVADSGDGDPDGAERHEGEPSPAARRQPEDDRHPSSVNPQRPATSDALFGRGINDAFIVQLRDMLARMNELGASQNHEREIIAALGEPTAKTERLSVQWRLAFKLRAEYGRAIDLEYAGQFRLDSSRLLVEGTAAVREASDDELAKLVVVDDVQDLTLAGMAFLEALAARGTKLVLAGNPDEAVQTFRGSYPEYLFSRALGEPLHARMLKLDDAPARFAADTAESAIAPMAEPIVEDKARPAAEPMARGVRYLDLVCSRVSLSIPTMQENDTPLAMRPGKLAQLPGSLPVRALNGDDPMPHDGSLSGALYRSSRQELDDVVWRIKREHLTGRRQWNDMAVIAHDNATVRAFGERLRRDGVPVSYSSVTRPINEEPFVQGLFALVELAQLRNGPLPSDAGHLAGAAGFVRSRVGVLLASPLISAGEGGRGDVPALLAPVESAMNALGSLAVVLGSRDTGPESDRGTDASTAGLSQASLPRLIEAWEALKKTVDDQSGATPNVRVDDSLVVDGGRKPGDLRFGVDALYLLLAFDGGEAGGAEGAHATEVLAAIEAVCGDKPRARAFTHLWALVAKVAEGWRSLPSREPQYVLWLAWNACAVAQRWQREALGNTAAGRAANDRLDAAMRLFDYAAANASNRDITGFLQQVRSMRIEADSLAKMAPVDQAVTLATPAGAAGGNWPLVCIPAVQQGVWPNLAPRNTMFGGEELASIMLRGKIDGDGALGEGGQLAAVLAAEQKSLFVAITRATERVRFSAVSCDDDAPSDFLYEYVPEVFDRFGDGDTTAIRYAQVGGEDDFAGLDADPRGLVAAGRAVLSREPAGSAKARDAAEALALLASHGVAAADPRNWPYTRLGAGEARPAALEPPESPALELGERASSSGFDKLNRHETEAARTVITLSPSAVDQIWACPVCWMLENRFSGPRPGSAAAGFGTLIHLVARMASEAGLDLPDFMAESGQAERLAEITGRMMRIYRQLRPDLDAIHSPRERYRAMRKDRTAEAMVSAIANYFVLSNTADYPTGNAADFEVGTLTEARCEFPFSALFSLGDILQAYNAIEGIDPVPMDDFHALMGYLAGGWPGATPENFAVRLNGRIDRVETRRRADGGEQVRLIDYKTGKTPGVKQIFSDLQLVCYQLGLAFAEGGPGGVAAVRAMPNITQGALFHVAGKLAPAESYGAESLFQPALFSGGHINTGAFTPRAHYPSLEKMLDIPELGVQPPDGLEAAVWQQFVGLRGTQAPWAMTMIARVFYAASASASDALVAHPQPWHVRDCRMLSVCPACAGRIDTVFEVRQA